MVGGGGEVRNDRRSCELEVRVVALAWPAKHIGCGPCHPSYPLSFIPSLTK
jgi:hypothetical protein